MLNPDAIDIVSKDIESSFLSLLKSVVNLYSNSGSKPSSSSFMNLFENSSLCLMFLLRSSYVQIGGNPWFMRILDLFGQFAGLIRSI